MLEIDNGRARFRLDSLFCLLCLFNSLIWRSKNDRHLDMLFSGLYTAGEIVRVVCEAAPTVLLITFWVLTSLLPSHKTRELQICRDIVCVT